MSGPRGNCGLMLWQAVISWMTLCSAFFWEPALTVSSVNLVLLVPDNDTLHGPAVGHRAELSMAEEVLDHMVVTAAFVSQTVTHKATANTKSDHYKTA